MTAEPRKASLVDLLRMLSDERVMGADVLVAGSHFVDLGAGFGKVVFGAVLVTVAERASGIELSASGLRTARPPLPTHPLRHPPRSDLPPRRL